jgi:microcystin-dependent protein
MGGWATAPIGYLLLDGSQVVGGAITYPNIASIYPSWVDTNDLWLPDANNRVPLGDNTGEVGVINGTMSKTIASANLPTHNHGLNNHTHGLNNHTHSTPNHSHDAQLQHVAWGSRTTSSGATKVVVAEENIGGAVQWDGTGIRQSAASGSGTSGGNTGNTAGSTANTTNGGFANTALDITPANITVRYAVKW